MIVAVVTVAVDMGRVTMVMRVFVDQVDPEQEIVIIDDVGECAVRGHGMVF
jgi:hypothetical protein